MCNLYSMTKGQAAIRAMAKAMKDRTGNLPPLPGIFPDYSAPIVRNGPEGREMAMARWVGFGSDGSRQRLATSTRRRSLDAEGIDANNHQRREGARQQGALLRPEADSIQAATTSVLLSLQCLFRPNHRPPNSELGLLRQWRWYFQS